MTINELRELSGMTRPQFAEYFGIPYRTLQDWELGNRKCPEYLLELMEYKLKHEGLIRADIKNGDDPSAKRKKCVDNSNYMGNPRLDGFWRADMERGGEDAVD